MSLNFQQVVAAINAGVNPKGNMPNQVSHWDLGSSFFFAGTVITTIGRTQFIILFEHWWPKLNLAKVYVYLFLFGNFVSFNCPIFSKEMLVRYVSFTFTN